MRECYKQLYAKCEMDKSLEKYNLQNLNQRENPNNSINPINYSTIWVPNSFL